MKSCNQFKHQHEFTYKQTFVTGLFGSIILLGVLNAIFPTHIEARADAIIISPVATEPKQVVVTKVSTPATTPLQDKIENEVKIVFGDDYPQAKQILDCENHARNPKAVNDNTKWGGRGIDWGVFQINDSWQGVTNKAFLTDYTINIRMAYNIFKSWGNTFQAWTCGKKLGI